MPLADLSRSILLLVVAFAASALSTRHAIGGLDEALLGVENRLEEETATSAHRADSSIYRRAVGEVQAPVVTPLPAPESQVLGLEECLLLAFANNDEIKQARQEMFAVGGTALIARSRFLPAAEVIGQYEHFRNFGSTDPHEDASGVRAEIRQRILEYGKDNPTDIALRSDQRDALFGYEDTVASVLSETRRAFFFVGLKDEQIATREKLLQEFKKQHEIKKERMAADNLSVKVDVLTARLNVLNEETRINPLTRQQFNRKVELLRLIGLPVRTDLVRFETGEDDFGLSDFDGDWATDVALAKSTEVALARAQVAEQERALAQLRYEYVPDMRLTTGYQDEDGRVGADLSNSSDTWALDLVGQPQAFDEGGTLGLFGDGISLSGPEPGWFAGLQVRIPLFEGNSRKGRRIREEAKLESLRAALGDAKAIVEIRVRQSYQLLVEQKYRVELEQERVGIAKERFRIKEQLKEIGKITDDELETFRTQFFNSQDSLFREQESLIEGQEDLRVAMRYFEPVEGAK